MTVRWILACVSHSPLAATEYLMPSPGLALLADLDVFQYAFTQLEAPSPGSVTTSQFRHKVCEKCGLDRVWRCSCVVKQGQTLILAEKPGVASHNLGRAARFGCCVSMNRP